MAVTIVSETAPQRPLGFDQANRARTSHQMAIDNIPYDTRMKELGSPASDRKRSFAPCCCDFSTSPERFAFRRTESAMETSHRQLAEVTEKRGRHPHSSCRVEVPSAML